MAQRLGLGFHFQVTGDKGNFTQLYIVLSTLTLMANVIKMILRGALVWHFLFLFSTELLFAQMNDISDKKIMKSFKQGYVKVENDTIDDGRLGNCAAIALIKASISTFGINNVCQIDTLQNSQPKEFRVKLKDNYSFLISLEEIEMARKRSFFRLADSSKISNDIYNYSSTLFAVLCKMRQLKSNGNIQNYSDAVDEVNAGENTSEVYLYLGLKKKPIQFRKVSQLNSYKNLVVKNRFHAAFSSKGYYDEWGKRISLKRFGNYHRNILKCGRCNVNMAYQVY